MKAVPAGKHTELVGAYVMEQTGMTVEPGTYQALMVVNDQDDFVAGVVISNFRGTDCEVSTAAETPAAWRPWVIRAVFKYVFDQLGCVRCTSITTKSNKRARDFLQSLGFQLEGNVRLGYDGRRDALIYGLLRSECRYLADDSERGDHGEKERTSGTSGPRSGGDGQGPDGHERRLGDGAGQPQPH